MTRRGAACCDLVEGGRTLEKSKMGSIERWVVFDVETTGFSPGSHGGFTESATRCCGGDLVLKRSCLHYTDSSGKVVWSRTMPLSISPFSAANLPAWGWVWTTAITVLFSSAAAAGRR